MPVRAAVAAMLVVLVPTSICRRLCSPCICTTHLPDWMVAVGDHKRAEEEGNGACVCSQCCLVGLHHDKHCVVRVSCVCSLAHATAVTTLFGDKAFGRESREKFARGKAMPERSQRVARRSVRTSRKLANSARAPFTVAVILRHGIIFDTLYDYRAPGARHTQIDHSDHVNAENAPEGSPVSPIP